MKAQTVILSAILAALPATALAGPHDHSSPPARSNDAPRQESHYSAPQRSYSEPQRSYSAPQRSYSEPQRSYSAPQRSYQSQPVQRYNVQPEQRYNQQQVRTDYQQRTYTAPQRSYQQPEQRYYQSSNTRYSQGYTSFNAGQRRAESMPRYRSGEVVRWGGDNGGWNRDPWYWHRGEAWYPEAGFWGGGFWGNFAIGLSIGGGGYSVQADSPGAQLLANYGLTQGPCDQDNMVDIFGPDGSQICAYPNDLVAPGQYQIDMSTLSLVSM